MNRSTTELCRTLVAELIRGTLTNDRLTRAMRSAYENGYRDHELAAIHKRLKDTFGDEAKQSELRG